MNFNTCMDLWQYLKMTPKKTVMYGMGNGADKILKICDSYGIEICDFFASDGFVRGHSFHGKRVLSYSEIKEKYGCDNIIVLLSFASSLDDVIDNILRISEECELYAPDVPVFGDTLFNSEFYTVNKDRISDVYDMLADDESRDIFEKTVLYKLTGMVDYLEKAVSDRREVYSSLLHAEEIKNYADLGAYTGDTIREISEYADLSKVWALEPDARTFKKLAAYADEEKRFEVVPINVAAWSGDVNLTFDAGGSRNSNVSGRGKTVNVKGMALDNIGIDQKLDYIKYDVEGSEREAILGSENLIKKYSPRLLISLYHRSEDIFELPELIKEINPKYKLYLRRYRYIPAWDLNLICLP